MVGSGEPGLADGDLRTAQFNRPQGVAVSGDRLYVADTENHAVRQVDWSTGQVTTLAGTGVQARGNAAGTGAEVAMNSPWDLVVKERMLYIAMAGSHQLWRLDRDTLLAQPHAGSGREDRV